MIRTYIISLITLLCTAFNANAQEPPTLTTKGGTYEIITDANQLQANDIVIIASHSLGVDGKNDCVRIMTNSLGNGYFGYYTGDAYNGSAMPNYIQVSDVNEANKPLEYIIKATKTENNVITKFNLQHENKYLSIKSDANKTIELSDTRTKRDFQLSSYNEETGVVQFLISNTYKTLVCENYTSGGKDNGCFTNMSKYSNYNPAHLYRKLQTETITISSVGYATLYYETKDVVLPEGLSAYTFKYDDKNNQLVATHNFKPGETIPQATAVILNAKAGDYEITLTTPSSESTDYSDINSLQGTDEETTLPSSGKSYYVLNNVNGKPTFCLASDGYTYLAHKAYLALPISAQQAKNTTFLLPNLGGNDITALPVVTNEPNDTPTTPTITYDLLGRQLPHSTTTPGVKIVNGKKVAIQH